VWESYGEAVDWKNHSDAARSLLVKALRRFRDSHPDFDFLSWPARPANLPASDVWRRFEETWKRSSLKTIKKRVVELLQLQKKYRHPIPMEWTKIAVEHAVREVFRVGWNDPQFDVLCHRLHEFVDEAAIVFKLGDPPRRETPIFTASEDYCSISYKGVSYTLTRKQSTIIKLLHKAHCNGTPALRKDYLLSAIESETGRVRDSFKGSALWGTLIVSNRSPRGTYQLKLE
jgi:hypothetical protein